MSERAKGSPNATTPIITCAAQANHRGSRSDRRTSRIRSEAKPVSSHGSYNQIAATAVISPVSGSSAKLRFFSMRIYRGASPQPSTVVTTAKAFWSSCGEPRKLPRDDASQIHPLRLYRQPCFSVLQPASREIVKGECSGLRAIYSYSKIKGH